MIEFDAIKVGMVRSITVSAKISSPMSKNCFMDQLPPSSTTCPTCFLSIIPIVVRFLWVFGYFIYMGIFDASAKKITHAQTYTDSSKKKNQMKIMDINLQVYTPISKTKTTLSYNKTNKIYSQH